MASASQAPAVPVASTANTPEVTNLQLRPVTGELVSKLDSKNAKSGDSVVLKTTEKATTADGVVIPKGSKIIGHVTEAQAKGQSGDNSRLTLQFDQAEIKGGQNLPIRSVIQSVAPASGDIPAGGDASMASSPAMGGAPGAGASSGASMGSHGPSSPTPSTTTGAPAMASDGSSTQNNGAPAVGTVVAHNGNVDIRTTAIPGVLIAGNSNGQPFANASGALLGAKQNVHLDGGTQMVVAIATAPTQSSR
jgi:hypothetical protein